MKRRNVTLQIEDGKWYAIGGFGYTHEVCCDCLKSHRVFYKLENGRIFIRYDVDAKDTQKRRKKAGVLFLKGPTRYGPRNLS